MKRFAFALLLAAPVWAADPAAKKPEKPFTPGGKWRQGDMQRPRPRVVAPAGFSSQTQAGSAPADAKSLFNGTDLSLWKRDPRKEDAPGTPDTATWKATPDYVEIVPKSGSIRTRDKFSGDLQIHVEWAAPAEVSGKSQGRGNSGFFITGFPEIQVLDSYDNDTYPDGQAAGLYSSYPPLVNASRKPGEWQTYDIIVERQRKDATGKVTKKARLTVIHNGIVVQWGREFDSSVQESDIGLQDHHNPVRYRNLWVRPINLTDPDSEGTPPPPGGK